MWFFKSAGEYNPLLHSGQNVVGVFKCTFLSCIRSADRVRYFFLQTMHSNLTKTERNFQLLPSTHEQKLKKLTASDSYARSYESKTLHCEWNPGRRCGRCTFSSVETENDFTWFNIAKIIINEIDDRLPYHDSVDALRSSAWHWIFYHIPRNWICSCRYVQTNDFCTSPLTTELFGTYDIWSIPCVDTRDC